MKFGSSISWIAGIWLMQILRVMPVVADEIPPAVTSKVDFHQEIAPLLQKSCVRCHTSEKAKGGFRLDTRELLLTGGESGPAVKPGKSGESYLVELVSGVHKDLLMPAQGARLTAEQIGLLRGWIDQDLPWDAGFRFGLTSTAPLAPRNPPLPPAAKSGEHPIDRLLEPYFARQTVTPGPLVSDARFARRVHLDLTGLLPTEEALAAFIADQSPDKRAKLIDKLLADKRNYTEHWLTFWNDALRNAYQGTGYIDGGRKQITPWLYQALYENLPYDRFVRELITPAPGAEGFINGIVWRGTVNASQKREMQAAQNVSQVFLGTNLKCASCHDSFVNQWKLSDAYGLAAVFADGPLEVHRCDKPTGELAQVHFLFPELGEIESSAPLARRTQRLSELLTQPENGRLARTMVNRLWTELLGHGLVEPVDDMDQTPWDADLLDWLAYDFQQHGYDLKHVLRQICTSRAYQLAAVGAPRPDESDFVFRGPIVKRMSAEQLADALATLTGVWPTAAAVAIPAPEADLQTPGQPTLARWVWNAANAERATAGGRVFFRRVLELPAVVDARIMLTCDNEFTVYVNGRAAGTGTDWAQPTSINITDRLRPGKNVIAVEAINYPDAATKKGLQFQGANPAGLLSYLWVKTGEGKEKMLEVPSDKSWRCSTQEAKNWMNPDYDDAAWQAATELGDTRLAPWDIEKPWLAAWANARGTVHGQIRASLLNDDAFSRALGRPNREQVVTRRESIATTLQALELTNGQTLDALLKQGAERWVQRGFASPELLIDALYTAAIGRQPTSEERKSAKELLGEKATVEGVTDMLWVVTMLPEFQLLY